ncbi:MAG: TolC family protein [Candidatus Fibromonas sp.]|nr:TolC family protein [Candidatus Fibromonas sp.]
MPVNVKSTGIRGCRAIFLAALSAICLYAQTAQPLTLKNSIELAIGKSEKLSAANEAVNMAKGKKTEARGKMLPSISLSGGYTRINDDLEIDMNEIRSAMIYLHSSPPTGIGTIPSQMLEAGLPSFTKRMQNESFWNATAQAQWTIFAGGRLWSGYKAATNEEITAEARKNTVQGEVAKETAMRYFNCKLAESVKDVQEQNLQTISQHFENTKKLEEAGQIALAERLRAEVALAEAKRNLEDAKRNAGLAKLALSNSIKSDTNFTLEFSWKKLDAPAEPQVFTEKILSKNPLLQQIKSEENRALSGLSANRGEWMPAIAAFGMRELYTNDLTLLQPAWAVGIKAEWNLFSGGTTLGKYQTSKAQARSLNYLQGQAKRDLELLAEKYLREWNSANEKLESLEKTEDLAQESLRAQTKAYAAGMATGLDVIDAQFALSRVALAKYASYYEAYSAIISLQELSGEAETLGELLK